MGYHVYRNIWETRHGKILGYFRKTGNAFDPFAVCVEDGWLKGVKCRNQDKRCQVYSFLGISFMDWDMWIGCIP